MTNREIAQEISSRIGNSPVPFDSVYSIALQIYNELGGEETQFDSVYSILLEILPLVEGGGGGNAIEEVDELPEASENKDKFYRVEGEDGIYAAKLLSSETITTNKLPDEQQIDKAYMFEGLEDIYRYKGSYKIICSDGELDWYFWRYNEGQTEGAIYGYAAEDNAVDSTGETVCLWVSVDDDIWTEISTTSASTDYTIQELMEYSGATFSDLGYPLIPAIYNALESAQIGNAYVYTDDGFQCVYTGEETTIEVDGESINVYKWYNDDEWIELYSTKRASEIYYSDANYESDPIISDTIFYWSSGTPSGAYNAYIPQLNAPESEQAGSAYILASDDATGDERYYTGTAYILVDADGVKSYTGYAFSNGDVTPNSIFTLLPANEIYNANADDIEVYVATNTEYELLPNNTIKLVEEGAEWYTTTLFDRFGVSANTCYIVKYQREETIEDWDWANILEGGGKLVLNGTADLIYNQDLSLSTIENVEIDGDVDITTLDSADVKFTFTLKTSALELGTVEASGTLNRYTVNVAIGSATYCRFTFPFFNLQTQSYDDFLNITYYVLQNSWTAKLMFASQNQTIME